ncbi:hypothetical protein ACHAWF_015518 [Thalassiosira exigua]
MVSYEGGKFVLRGGRSRRRVEFRKRRIRRVLLVAASSTLFYVLVRTSPAALLDPAPRDSALLRLTRDAGVAIVGESRDASGADADAEPYVAFESGDTNDDDEGAVVSEQASAILNVVDSGADLDVSSDLQGESDGYDEVEEGVFASTDSDQALSPDLSLNEEYLKYLRSLAPIPKKVHIFFPDKDYWKKSAHLPFVQNSILSLKSLNPDWNVTVYDDDMIDDVIHGAAEVGLIPIEERDILVGVTDAEKNMLKPSAHIVERSDIARLLLMYSQGGFYVDVDRLISKRLSDDVLGQNTRLCLPTSSDANFCQDLMCTAAKNDMFLAMIRDATNTRLQVERRRGWCKGGSLFDLGPTLYNRHVFSHVFLGHGEDLYEEYRRGVEEPRVLLEGTGRLVVTKNEASCNDGLLVDDSLPRCYDRGQLYNEYGMQSWAPQVNAVWEGR